MVQQRHPILLAFATAALLLGACAAHAAKPKGDDEHRGGQVGRPSGPIPGTRRQGRRRRHRRNQSQHRASRHRDQVDESDAEPAARPGSGVPSSSACRTIRSAASRCWTRRRQRPHRRRRQRRREAAVPKRTDLRTILIIGAGPIVIGQACEFDYSGAQACKALKEEGYRVVLVNSNPATIMTDPETADAVYIEPINWQTVREDHREGKTRGAAAGRWAARTALNCALDLADHGVLEKYGVELLGASRNAIRMAEDRELFRVAMREIGLECPKAEVVRTFEQALDAQVKVGYPTIIRPSFTLGGSGGGIAYNKEEFEEIVKRGLDLSPVHEVLVGNRCSAGRNSKWKWSATPRTTASSSARSRTSIRWACTPAIRHGGAGADLDRQGIPAPARCQHRGVAQDRRGYRRLQRAVRHQRRGRPRGRHRDESARVALLRAGVEGDRFSDRQGRGPNSRSATRSTNCATRSPAARRRRRSSRRSTTSSPRFHVSRSRNSRPPMRA